MNYDQLFKNFENLNILVVGDVMIDGYYFGKVNRISPEAPVPVVDTQRKEDRLGGAANVALNILAMGANPIVCSVIGNDEKANVFKNLLSRREISSEGLIYDTSRSTTVKTRIISSGQQMLRVDEESTKPLGETVENQFLENIKKIIDQQPIHCIILQDYNKGVLTKNVITKIIELSKCNKIPCIADPKIDNFLVYQNIDLFKPNLRELREGLKLKIDPKSRESVVSALETLQSKLNNEISFLTLSEHGVMIKNETEEYALPAYPRKIVDVSGAGDTVISVTALGMALDLPIKTVAALANLAGGLVCEYVGVVPINKEQLLAETNILE